MAKERIIIEVTERGSRTVKRALGDIGETADRSGRSVNFLKRALLGVGVGLVVREVLKLADASTVLRNKLAVVTTSQEQLNNVQKELLEISNRTRSSLETNAALYSRLALSTRGLQLSQKDLLNIVESLNLATKLSGATTQEAAQGLLQLSQGLASAKLSGDELRSVLEQLPVVADVIAKQLGITREQMRLFGEQGKITASAVVAAFQNARQELLERFGKTVPTVAESLVILKNHVIILIDSVNRGTGATQLLIKGIILLGKHVEFFARVVLSVVLAKAIQLTISGFKNLAAAIVKNPLGAFLTILTLTVTALISFSDQITLSSDGFVTLQDFAVAAFSVIQQGLGQLISGFSIMTRILSSGSKTATENARGSFEGLLFSLADIFDTMLGFFRGLASSTIVIFSNLPEIIGHAIIVSFNFLIDQLNSLFRFVIGGLNELGAQIQEFSRKIPGNLVINFPQLFIPQIASLKDPFAKEFEDIGKAAGLAFDKGLEQTTGARDLVDAVFGEARALSLERRIAQGAAPGPQRPENAGFGGGETSATSAEETAQIRLKVALQGINEELDRETLLAGQTNEQRKITIGLLEIENTLAKNGFDIKSDTVEFTEIFLAVRLREIQALQRKRDLEEEINGPERERLQRLRDLKELLDANTISQDQYTEAVRMTNEQLERSNTAVGQLILHFKNMKVDLVSLGKEFVDVADNAVGALSDAIAELIITADFENFKKSLSDLLRAIAKEIVKLIIQFIILKTLQIALGGGGAGAAAQPATTGTTGALVYGQQAGGPVTGRRPVLVGERGPELFVPPSSGSIVKNSDIMAPEVTVNVVNVSDPDEVTSALSTSKGEQTVLNILQKRKRDVAQILKG